jgi:uncharacterized membrane protein
MVKRFVKWFINGVLVIAPIGVTFYVLAYLFKLIDGIGKNLIDNFTVNPIPGSGIIITILLVTFIGFLSQLWLSKQILEWTEKMIVRFPGLKTIYSMVKETIEALLGEKRSFSQVVLITEEDGAKRVGFLTTENVTAFGLDETYISVYVPHGLQVSGELKLYPRDKVQFIDIPVEEAMRFCLTAGVASQKKEKAKDTR